ncbi:DUF3800 domain-containing protein [Methylobacterium aerolatum]|uniref:DUF3800 domain-containing protein n=1 Tax=Methylobacterium aerolatum TaxID=418708 RepID=A0ABU0I0K0_9HYPH|nr:DUF3800 domain-containing protein [Methylobacterium aerolatum]MDQ0448130.1 hypothetical protein [Methylobacterium aerolatum]GJD34002.1 hypothetical protein FMGBMHLM_0898 [Methylobacterium aerolatum]
MQLVYLDEAGISRRSDEPYVVVAGVIVNADQKWKSIEDRFIDLTDKYVPDYESTYGQPFIFHAMDIWHGSGNFPRDRYTRESRIKLLGELASIPFEFDLPVVAGYLKKADYENYLQARSPGMKAEAISKWSHAVAFFSAIRRVEHWMKTKAPNEVAMLIAEDTDRVKGLIGALHAAYTDRSYHWVEGAFQSEHIVDAVHFTKKKQSILLQVADHMAFIVKRRLNKCPHIEPLWKKVQPQISYRGVEDYGIALRVPTSDVEVVRLPEPPASASSEASPLQRPVRMPRSSPRIRGRGRPF